MADKILRAITDVEIVEQMTENDTVLIEHGGEIKRAKGVASGSGGGSAGGGKVYTISDTYSSGGEVSTTIDVSYDEFAAAVSNGDTIIVQKRYIGPDGKCAGMESCTTVKANADGIQITLAEGAVHTYHPDGSFD